MTGNLVVTGASGYLGSYLVRSAAQRRYPTKGMVRAAVPWMDARLQHVSSEVSGPDSPINGADVVVHLAAPNETAFRSNPEEASRQTVEVSRDVAQACARAGVRRLIYVSTVHVYGSALQPGASITEETPAVPTGDYGWSRLRSEEVVRAEVEGVQVVIFRLTNGIGAPVSPLVDRWTLVANDLCRQAAEGGRLHLLQPGQWRDFIPLDAVVDVILAASEPAGQEVVRPGVYNLSAGRSITVLDLATLIAEEAGRMGIQVSIDAPAAPPEPPYLIDNGKIRRTGVLPDDLSLSPAVRDTLGVCVGAVQGNRASTPLGN